MIAIALSLSFFIYYFQTGQVLLYGDAVAHMNIARRVVDSLTPGPKQFGTVWLPLPHLITLPFVISDWAWRTGVAGSIGSMAAYVLAVLGVFRIVKALASRTAAWTAALIFACNPNLLYMQATAMTESIYLAAMVWAVAYFAEWKLALRFHSFADAAKLLWRCGAALAAASLTRYDGWFLAAVIGVLVLDAYRRSDDVERQKLKLSLRNFILITASVPVFWFTYNASIYGNALEFANGPYSARAIAERTTRKGEPPHPGYHSLATANTYFIKAAKLNVGDGPAQHLLFWLAVLGGTIAAFLHPRRRPLLLLWVPIPFYALNIAYGGVPIFMPQWWPHGIYNVRYGLQLLPAISIFSALLFEVCRDIRLSPRLSQAGTVASLIVTVASYAAVWWHTPICLQEARTNSESRIRFESALASELGRLPADATFLMYSSSHVGALQMAGIHLRRVVNEGNYLIWESALAQPAKAADYVIASEGDLVTAAVAHRSEGLIPVLTVDTPGQPRTVIYRAAPPGSSIPVK